MSDAQVLVINAGSSSIKTALFDANLRETLRIEAAGIGTQGSIRVGDGTRHDLALPDHTAALAAIFDALSGAGIQPQTLRAAAHRVVHGGAGLTASARITPAIRAAMPHWFTGSNRPPARHCRTVCWPCTWATAHRCAPYATDNPWPPPWAFRPSAA